MKKIILAARSGGGWVAHVEGYDTPFTVYENSDRALGVLIVLMQKELGITIEYHNAEGQIMGLLEQPT